MNGEALARIVAQLDAIDCSDPEHAHGEADALLLYAADTLIAEAYSRVVDRCDWWAGA